MDMLPDRGDLRRKLIQLLEEESSGDQVKKRLLKAFLEQDQNLHSQIIHLLTHLEYQEGEAKLHWKAIENHRKRLSQNLDRDAGLQVAILDYFFNLHPRLRNPKVIEIATFTATERDAFMDSLTGLYNRLYFDTSLRRETMRAHRYGLTFSLVLLDLDDFKNVNDRFGHLVGDDALSACSDVIRNSVREIDVPCRYGGEEFALILPQTSRSGAYIVSERIRSDIESLFQQSAIRNCRLELSVSGGVSIFPIDSSSEEGMVAMADRALYRSKREGKNQITLHADEKRRSPRFEAVKTLTFRSPFSGVISELTSQTKNLSRDGALVESGVPLTVGTELELTIKIQQPAQSYTLKGKVVRLREFQQGHSKRYDVGIAFVAENEDELRQIDGLTEELYRPLDQAG
jgi:diguanylate cyclase (GGDEF)-like protein